MNVNLNTYLHYAIKASDLSTINRINVTISMCQIMPPNNFKALLDKLEASITNSIIHNERASTWTTHSYISVNDGSDTFIKH